jgi:RNase P/RNase MRP subunit p30
MVIKSDNLNEVRKKIEKAFKNSERVIVYAGADEFNRKILEDKRVDYLIDVFGSGKDRLRQRDSGLNQVLCKLAKSNGISIGFDISKLVKGDEFVSAKVISRLRQNIRLCRKYKVHMVLVNLGKRNKKDVFALLLSLGMSTSMAKYSVENGLELSS